MDGNGLQMNNDKDGTIKILLTKEEVIKKEIEYQKKYNNNEQSR